MRLTLAVLVILGCAAHAAGEELLEAARAGDVAAVERLLDAGADVNTADKYGSTALAAAAVNGRLEVVELLLERGADPNIAETFYGARPLDMALFFADKREVALVLLEHGAEDRDQALGSAVQSGDLELARAALAGGPIRESTMKQLAMTMGAKEEGMAALLETVETRPDPDRKSVV